jgi:hypothetical protein
MPTFRAPQYTKVTNPKTGTQEPCYTFHIEFTHDDSISFVAETPSDITLQSLQNCVLDNLSWWNTFIKQFLESSAKFFSKPYTIETINKITKHTLTSSTSSTNTSTNISYPLNVLVKPNNIQICGGVFIVNWGYVVEAMVIDIPDLEEPEHNTIELTSLPVSNENRVIDEIEELNMDNLSVGGDSTDDALELDSPIKFYEKQKVKEARLKAKLAVYKAQRQMAQYYEKYGNDISDSDTSDDEDDSGDEEVQL